MKKYRVVKHYMGAPAWRSEILSEADAVIALKQIQDDHAALLARHLSTDPRGDASPVVQRLRQWTFTVEES